MEQTITIYDDINIAKNFFRYKKSNNEIVKVINNINLNSFNTNKYNYINIDSDLCNWIKTKLKKIDAIYGHLYVLDETEKIIQLRDKIWNNKMKNENISEYCDSFTFAFEAYQWIKEGNQLYFFIN